MSERWKTVLLILVLIFYIFLTAMGVADEAKGASQNEQKSNDTRNDLVIVRNQTINVTSFLNNSAVRAFKSLHHSNIDGEFKTAILQQSNFFKNVKYPSGQLLIYFSEVLPNSEEWHKFRKPVNTSVTILIVDGEYLDDTIYRLEFNDPIYQNFNASTKIFSVSNRVVDATVVDKLVVTSESNCTIDLTVDFSKAINDTAGEDGAQVIESAPIEIHLSSPSSDCRFALKTVLGKDMKDLDRKAINYSLLLTFIAALNLYSIAKMIRQALDSPAYASQLSLLTIGFITVWDTYVCIAHLFLALTREQLFHFFIMPTFWYFILFSIFELKLLVVIWKARYEHQLDTYEQVRKAMANFHFKFCTNVAMILILTLLYNFVLYNSFLLLMNLFLIPQIIHNTMRGGRVEFDKTYMFNVVAMHAFLPLYFRGCPQNIMDLRPSASFCLGLISIIAAQIFFVYYQSIHGSKFFIPARFLPAQYNYLYSLPDDLETGNDFDDCAVCMSGLHQEPGTSMTETPHKRIVLNRLKPKEGQVMKTPCNHKFHVSCLLEWMAIKTECPTCRAPLPLLE